MVSCFSWFLRDTHASCECHACLWFPRSPGDQQAGPALCRLRAGGPAAPSSLAEDAACPSPGSPPGGGGCTCVWAWGRLCVSSAPEAGSGSPDAVTLKLDAVRLERDVGRLGTDAGKLGTAELGLSPSYGPGRRLQNLWSHISPSNSGSSLNALPFLYTEVVQIDSFEHLSRTCILQTVQAGCFPCRQGPRPRVWSRGTELRLVCMRSPLFPRDLLSFSPGSAWTPGGAVLAGGPTRSWTSG